MKVPGHSVAAPGISLCPFTAEEGMLYCRQSFEIQVTVLTHRFGLGGLIE